MLHFKIHADMDQFVKTASANEIQETYGLLIENKQYGEFIKLASMVAFYDGYQSGLHGLTPDQTQEKLASIDVEAEGYEGYNFGGNAGGGEDMTITKADADYISEVLMQKLAAAGIIKVQAGAGPSGGAPGAAGAGAGVGAGAPGAASQMAPDAIEQVLQNAGVIAK